jgi:dihydrofolate reductase
MGANQPGRTRPITYAAATSSADSSTNTRPPEFANPTRRLYETMLVWETDPSLRDNEDTDAFADVWSALPKVVFSRTLDGVQGNARLAEAPLAEEVAAALDATDKDVEIGGAGLAAAAIELGLVDELRMFRYPVVVGGGTPFLPPVTEDIALDLIETRTFGSRVIYERYGRARDESD